MGSSRKKPNGRHQRYSNERLGRMAQDHVGLFAEAAHLNRSASNPDLDGWDFHFSVPRDAPLDGSNFFDADPARTAMFAQVKGTVGATRRRSIALSHWRHAATMAMPFFFIIVEFDHPPAPARLFVVHVDEPLVAAVAERLRREGAEAKRQAPALNKLTIDLVWDSSHEVPCNGDGLRDALVRYAGHDMMGYAAAKRGWWEAAGRATLENHLTLRFGGPRTEAQQRLADWALGLTGTLRVDQFHRVEHRWGIPRAFEPSTDVLVSFGAPPSLGRAPVRISNRSGTEHAEFEADVYCNVCFVPHLPEEMWALRLVSKFLELTLRAKSNAVTVRLNIPPNQPPVSLAELATLARVVRLLQGAATLWYTIPNYGGRKGYNSQLLAPRDAMKLDGDVKAVEVMNAAEAASTLAALFSVPDLKVRPTELYESASALEEWRLAQTSDAVTAQIDMLNQDGLVEGETAVFLGCFSTTLAGYELVAAAVVEGPVSFVGARGRITAKPTFARRWAVNRKDWNRWRSREFPRLVHELALELEAKGKHCLISDRQTAELVDKYRNAAKNRSKGKRATS
jgi:hypothetical protein